MRLKEAHIWKSTPITRHKGSGFDAVTEMFKILEALSDWKSNEKYNTEMVIKLLNA